MCVLNELVTEEKRMSLSIASIFRYHDVIEQMLYLYFEMIIKDTENENESGKVQGITKTITGHIADSQTGKAARFRDRLRDIEKLIRFGYGVEHRS